MDIESLMLDDIRAGWDRYGHRALPTDCYRGYVVYEGWLYTLAKTPYGSFYGTDGTPIEARIPKGVEFREWVDLFKGSLEWKKGRPLKHISILEGA